MRTVCYIVDTVILNRDGPTIENLTIFGTINDVLAELKKAEEVTAQALIVNATDPVALSKTKCREQIIRQLMNHDIDTLPKYPAWGGGEAVLNDADNGYMYTVKFKVSIRGDASLDEPKPKTVSILLPPGVRL